MKIQLNLQVLSDAPRPLTKEEKTFVTAMLEATFEESLDLIFDQENPDISAEERAKFKRLMKEANAYARLSSRFKVAGDGATEGGSQG